MNKLILAIAVGTGIHVSCGTVVAQTIFVSRNDMGPYGTNRYSGGTLGDWPSDYNGQMIITANEGSSFQPPLFQQTIWCIDQPGYIGLGENPGHDGNGIDYTVLSINDFTTDFRGNSITRRQAGEIAAIVAYADDLFESLTAVDANAIQAAITNIEYGTTSDGGEAVNQRTLEIMEWAGSLSDDQLATYELIIYYSPDDQTVAGGRLIPAPSTLVLAGVCLAGASRRRRV